MSKSETINISVNENVRLNAENTLKSFGLTLSEAVNMFLQHIGDNGSLSCDLIPPAPDCIIVKNKKDVDKKLLNAEEDIKSGRIYTHNIFDDMRKKYGL